MNNYHRSGYRPNQPNLGATFSPGGSDDFYMPEVISPAPQRVMPEVPENMQDNIAHLEQQAQSPRRTSEQMTSDPYASGYPPSQYGDIRRYDSQYGDHNGYNSPHPNQSHYHNQAYNSDQQYHHNGYEQGPQYSHPQTPVQPSPLDEPHFSPFPALKNPPPNVPPTDDQREANLEAGRQAILSSNDAQYQLDWAQDALSYVEVAQSNEDRLSLVRDPRPCTPRIEHQLRTDAINIVEFLQNQGHPKAEFLKGTWLEWGKFGYREDKKEAYRCYSRSADGGYARAEYRIGMQFESSNDVYKAIPHYQKGAAANDSASNYRLGMMILLGQHGMPQDYPLGLRHIRDAALTADENAPQGAYVYGMLQARDLPQVQVPEVFLPQDLNSARINIEKAAFFGFAKAQMKMGSAYELCQLGCDFNPTLSIHYNALAARQGEAEAEMAISKWFLCGHEGVFEKSEQLAFEYAQRAASSGLSTAEFAMGYFYEIGIYVQADLKEAKKWYTKAAANGNKDAAGRIDGISRSKTMSRHDHEKVALAKIKSQRANAQQAMPMPGNVPPMLQQRPLEMPDINNLSIHSNPYGRPPSARPGDQAYLNPEIRPGSAFGINPNLNPNMRPPSAPQGGRSDNYRMPSGPPKPRPHGPNDGYHSPGPGGHPHRLPPGPAGPPGYRQPGGGLPGPGSPPIQGGRGIPPPKSPGHGPPPGANFGFSAPPDPRYDQRGRLQKSGNPNVNKAQPQPPRIDSSSVPPERRSPRTPGAGPSPGVPPPGYPNTQGGYPSRFDQRPPSRPQQDSRPSQPQNSQSSGQRPPTGQSGTGTGTSSRPTGQQRLPGKGPKTFEEMGVPQGKSQNDCVVM